MRLLLLVLILGSCQGEIISSEVIQTDLGHDVGVSDSNLRDQPEGDGIKVGGGDEITSLKTSDSWKNNATIKVDLKYNIRENRELLIILESPTQQILIEERTKILEGSDRISLELTAPKTASGKKFILFVFLIPQGKDRQDALSQVQKDIELLGSGIPMKAILDTDFGDDGDDLLSLMMLHHLQDKGEVEIIAVGQCNDAKGAVASIDIINTYYGRPDIPVGQLHGDVHKGDQYISFLLENYPQLTDLPHDSNPDVIGVYRKALANAPDGSVRFISVGLKQNMAKLLKSGPDAFSDLSGLDLVKKKVYASYDLGGFFPSGREFNYYLEPEDTKYFLENWPTPMILIGERSGQILVGEQLRKMKTPPGEALEEKLRNGWTPNESQQSCFDCAAVLAAVKGENNRFNMVEGCNTIQDDGSNDFQIGNSDCQHSYADFENLKSSIEELQDEIREMILAPPKLK